MSVPKNSKESFHRSTSEITENDLGSIVFYEEHGYNTSIGGWEITPPTRPNGPSGWRLIKPLSSAHLPAGSAVMILGLSAVQPETYVFVFWNRVIYRVLIKALSKEPV